MVDFLHGVETQEIKQGPRPIREVKSGIIFLVGSAPIHHVATPDVAPTVNRPSLVLSDKDVPSFGPDLSGYSIPNALNAGIEEGAGTVVVVNVFDPTKSSHRTVVVATSRNIVDGKVTLPDADLISATVTTDEDAACVEGEDYTIDRVTGVITIIEDGELDGEATCKVAHVKANPAGIVADDIIGTISAGIRSGAQSALDCASLFGFKPKILIAPRYSSQVTVAAALRVLADELKLRAIALADAPSGTSIADAISARGTAEEADLTLADDRLYYCHPHVKKGSAVEPLSQRLAGIIARTDRELGYHHSPSNKEILGATGLETPVTAALNDPQCEANQLNANGIVTVFSGFGLGLRTWGNRASSFPGSSDITTFMAVRRTIDMIDEAIEQACLRYVDGPVTSVLIDAILGDVMAFIRILETRGALVPGSSVTAPAAENPPVELAAGHITFVKTYCPPPPAEKITQKSVIDTTLLANVFRS